jgi:fatty-acyl-CoA synthase
LSEVAVFAEVVRSRRGDEHVGLRFEDDSWTWGQVVQESADRAAWAETLRPRGGKQLHIGVLLENVPDYVFWLCAAALSGAVIVGINPTRRGAELAHDIRHTDCDVIITEDKQIGLLDGIEHGVAAERIFNIDSAAYTERLAEFRGAQLPAELPAADAILLLLFSSGSTGAPKAVICSNGRYGYLADTLRARTELTRESVSYLSMPMFHGNALMNNFAPAMNVGATVCLARKFSASGFVRDIHRYGATFANYVGRALAYVLAQPIDPRDADSTLELVLGTEASAADIVAFSKRFGCRVSEGYGLSEGVLRINRTPDSPPDSLGLPVNGMDVRVLNEDTGEECPPAQIDESGRLLNADEATGQIVAINLAHTFEGYYNNPEAMADRVRGNDFWSGDLAYRDENGQFFFAGRSSDWLRVDSENFASGPVERILERWEPIGVAAVYAVPDPRTGDQVMCTLQLNSGYTFDPDAFADFLDAQADMGTKWRPRFVRIIAQVPTTGSNKIAKTVLRRAAWVTDDPMYWRPGTEQRFRPLHAEDVAELEKEFVEHGRAALLPAGAGKAG